MSMTRPLTGFVTGVMLMMSAGASNAAEQYPVNAVTVSGNQRIEASTILTYAGFTEGELVTPAQINAAFRRLNATGLFRTVEIVPANGALSITVEENPTVNRIVFEGNKRVTDEILSDLVPFQERRALDAGKVEETVDIMLANYQAVGRYNATVEAKLIERANNRVDVVFEISEGDVTEFSQISFIGNSVFTEGELKNLIASGEAGPFSTLMSNDTYSADRLELDKQLLREAYLNKGYAEFEILSTTVEITPDRDAFTMVFHISEGPRYRFGDLSVESSIVGTGAADFSDALPDMSGDVYAIRHVEALSQTLGEIAGELGYAFAIVKPVIDRDAADNTVDVVFQIEQGERSYIERIDIAGNTATLDRVIRRQFDLVEGDAFDANNVRRAVDRIRALGYFSTVDVRTSAGSASDKAVVEVEVEDQPTGNIGLGVAVSSQDGAVATLDLSERNLLGRGQTLALSVSAGGSSNSISISFEEPQFLDRDLAVGFSIYNDERDQDNSSFQETNRGFEPYIEFPMSEDERLRFRSRISSDTIRDVGSSTEVSQVIQDDAGTQDTLSFGYRYTLDRRNSKTAPTDGYIAVFSQDLAGLAGGDAKYLRTEGRLRFNTAFNEGEYPAYLELAAGALVTDGNNSRITDRFFLGGDSFRGFSYAGIGPRDRDTSGATTVDDSLGGNYYAMLRTQMIFPIGIPDDYGMMGGVFMDVGSVWGMDQTNYSGPVARGAFSVDDGFELRSAVGASFFWDTPIGPLRFNFARPIHKNANDNVESFRFTIGGKF